MHGTPYPPGLRNMVAGSLIVHAGVLLLLLGLPRWKPEPRARQVLITQLVRLGPPRPSELLPRKEDPPPPPPPPPPPAAKQPAVAPPVQSPPVLSAAPSSEERTAARRRLNKAVERLKKKVEGQADGMEQGEVSRRELQVLGDRYATLVQRCLQSHYVVEGTDPAQLLGRHAMVHLRIQSQGKVMDFKIVESSGLSVFDQAVARAIQKCNQLAPPPREIRSLLRTEGLEIDFQP